MKPLYLSTALASSLFALPVFADVIALDPDALTNSSEVVVTANRTTERLDRVGASITVIDKAQIKASQAVVVSDLLVQTPGVTFSRNGGVGGLAQINIRGADSDQTVILVNGVKINDPSTTDGRLNFGHFLLGDIAKIEVLRGPQSTLWGSDAMGGVVNVITTQPNTAFGVDGQIEGGSRGTGYFRGGVGGMSERIDWRIAGGYFTTTNISMLDKRNGGREKDPYRNGALSGTAVLHITDNISLDVRGYYINARNNFDDAFPAPSFTLADSPSYGEVQIYVGYAGLNVDLFDGALKNRVAVLYTETNTHNYNPSLAVPLTFVGIGRNTRFEYQGTWTIAEGYEAVFGAESQRSKMTGYSPTVAVPNPARNVVNINIHSIYAQVRGTVLPGLTLTAGGRGDSHSFFGEYGTAQVAAAWSLNDGNTILRSSYGLGFKAPSLYQLLSQYGNQALNPQEGDGWDAGIEQHVFDGLMAMQATYFSRDTSNLINFLSCPASTANPLCRNPAPRTGYYYNTAKSDAQGIELQGTIKPFDGFTITANYTYTEAIDQSIGAATFGKDLPRRPRNAANLTATYIWPFGLSTTAALRYAGRSFDNVANTTVLASYALFDLRASYPLNENFDVYGRIENLFDKEYQTIFRYGQPGRGVFVGLQAKL